METNNNNESKLDKIKFNFSYSLKDSKFEVDRMQNELIVDYIRFDERFRRAFNSDKTLSFIGFLQDKAKLSEPIHLTVSGTVRGGKSHSMLSICFLINYFNGRMMDIRYVCANSYEFLERIQEMPMEDLKNSCFLIDEEKGGIAGVGSITKGKKLTDIQNIIAKNNISTISICPTKFSNKDAFYGLRIFGREFNQKVNRFMLYNLQESINGRPVGMIYIPIFSKLVPPEISQPIIDQYEAKKDNWIEKEQRGQGDVLYEIKRKTAQVFLQDESYKQLKKKSEKLVYISQKLGSEWSKGETEEILALISIYEKGIKMES